MRNANRCPRCSASALQSIPPSVSCGREDCQGAGGERCCRIDYQCGACGYVVQTGAGLKRCWNCGVFGFWKQQRFCGADCRDEDREKDREMIAQHPIQRLRRERGLTQKQFAERCGLRLKQLEHIEQGDYLECYSPGYYKAAAEQICAAGMHPSLRDLNRECAEWECNETGEPLPCN